MPNSAPSPSSTVADGHARTRQPLVFGGIPEAEGWVLAPIAPRDRVHFRVDHELPLEEFRAELPDGVTPAQERGPWDRARGQVGRGAGERRFRGRA